jgi:four helix bundle protein
VDQLQRASSSIPLNIAEGRENIPALKNADSIEWKKRSATEYAGIF